MKINQTFPELQNEKPEQLFNGGEIDVLIRFNYAALHLVIVSVGNLLLMSNKFGYCVAGSCESKLENENLHINYAIVNFNSRDEVFLNIESMGVRCLPQCGSCKCGKCSIGRTNCTIKEEREQRLIESGLVFNGKFGVSTYPWIKDPRELPDNKFIANKMLQSTEKRIMKDPKYAQIYGMQIKDMLVRGLLGSSHMRK